MVKVIAGVTPRFSAVQHWDFPKHQAIRTDEWNWKTRWN